MSGADSEQEPLIFSMMAAPTSGVLTLAKFLRSLMSYQMPDSQGMPAWLVYPYAPRNDYPKGKMD